MVEKKYFAENVIPKIESIYENLTATEKEIADYFIQGPLIEDLSAKSISDKLHVSEPSLSRFAQKCGFKGYREFVFLYKQNQHDENDKVEMTDSVFQTYQDLLSKSFSIIDMEKIKKVNHLLLKASNIYVFGTGSSMMCADEFKFRFMRMGLKIASEPNNHFMKIQTSILKRGDLVIGISVSGKTQEILDSLQMAKKNGAKTVLITSNDEPRYLDFCDEVILVAVIKNLENGKFISPQFPVLIVIDILFAYSMSNNEQNVGIYDKTIDSVGGEY
ncbi:MurR/RpiR family transcriptional regulator [Tetragenococcus halophilus]|uniref:MurR/RpiR family transcriptional regulator n=1 Tax=Tetragenococcus halophilus TaxID=51669 RepID=UPI001F2546E5|nr:MurR/RpiR family transcriptional regulator [Tetragenococcus halophilus]MDN6140040.1 MurR/RpiR family transcriptional regulator [Tetragenococcus koreensis]MDN6631351.1 MurR/RpiR family transcriptional regulator [Staphylococcus equorum]MCF1675291.1 MurR/RpiR family transcriptional regulator [Tetragenococcus halophilus]MDN6146765.1 MurR/RpiR family transcriptional regulator [Tetragenococcus koreensis]MDN6166231.1 MurR/RpiR family transcriptional regulator [Tetragenococcus koreensis]